jgi:hypothetical protein
VVAKVEEPKPAPKPVVAKVEEPKPAPKPVVAKVDKPKPGPAQGSDDSESSLTSDEDRRAAQRESIPGVHKRDKRKLPTNPRADSPPEEKVDDAPLGSSRRAAKPSTDKKDRKVPSKSDVTRRIETPKPADSGLPFSTLTMAGIAAGALIVLAVAVQIFRKRSLPHDLDVTSFADGFDDDAEANDSETSDPIPAEGFSINDPPTDGPKPEVEEQNTAAYSLSEVAAATETEPETGLYNEDSEGEKPMDMETNNLPSERDDFGTPPPAAVIGGGDNDMSQLVQELASRIANLETRLDEANDSRERLERQVAAQSEELRVQRAAIARTQRALRSLSRTEEDQATEPALREPSQPAG